MRIFGPILLLAFLAMLVAGLVLMRERRAGADALTPGSGRRTRGARIVAKRIDVRGPAEGTAYYATFEFVDGSRAEYRMRGGRYGLLAEGDSGSLTTSGDRFVDFVRGGMIQDAPPPGGMS